MDDHAEMAIDEIFDWVDDNCLAGNFKTVDERLLALDLSEMSVTIMIAWVSITYCARNELSHRPCLIQRMREELAFRGESEDRIESLLKGLS